jgi:DUF4097 and DUF4098 domain-containing protein YvlB
MRNILVAGLVALVALQPNTGNAQSISKTIEVESGQRLQLRSDVGSVEVTGYAGSEVRVAIEVRGLDDDEFKVEVNKDASGVRIDGDFAKSRWFHSSNRRVRFEIQVPLVFNIDIKTQGGSISVENVEGSVDVRSSGGGLRFTDITGHVVGRTSGGAVSADKIAGSLDLYSSGGGFDIVAVTGDVDLRTSGGSISLERVHGAVSASTSGGSITARFEEVLSKDCELETSGGSVTTYLSAGTGVNLDASTSGGRVRSDFDIDGIQRKHSARGKINGGGPRLNLESSGGGIRIKKS